MRLFCDEILAITVRCHQERFFLSPFSVRNAIRKQRKKKKGGKPRRRGVGPKRVTSPRGELDAVRRRLASGEPIQAQHYQESAYNVVGVWLAKALEKFPKAKMFGYMVMGNHVHYLLWVPDGEISSFMKYLNGNMAKALNRLLGRNHQFWASRFSMVPVLDSNAALDRACYFHLNPKNAGLIDTPARWPGVSNIRAIENETTETFLFFNRTKWHRNHKPKRLNKYLEEVAVETCKIPGFEHLADDDYAALLKRLVQEGGERIELERKDTPTLPGELLRKTDPFARPNAPKRSKEPICHTTCPVKRAEHLETRKLLWSQYKRSSHAYLRGDTSAEFPSGTVPPPLIVARAA